MAKVIKGIVSPQYYAVPVDRELARRVSRIVHAVGEREAAKRLEVGKPTIEAAVGYGALRSGTIGRLRLAVERVEFELAPERAVGT